ncbi:transporter [Saccharopolyspora sp. HNM0983]|uniref:Transporter n=1 Tax=Saccharopolyspora montiporae TaxID=2781240 RepID=A0A929G0A9_9PSEU|nr:transporter [Saccharopolyspora sp. HNM0983]MBE9373418.1 transporter [Saccharopolyspora sp. HNM0983]
MERLIWVLVLVALAGLVVFGMRRGWSNRRRRQAAELAEFPTPPPRFADEPVLAELTGMYMGTTKAGDWQDRIVVGDIGHRATASVLLHREGLLVQRSGASPVWIPAESFTGARVDHKLANKVVPGVGLLVVRWRLGDQLLDTGFRADDAPEQARWAEAIGDLVPDAEGRRSGAESS